VNQSPPTFAYHDSPHSPNKLTPRPLIEKMCQQGVDKDYIMSGKGMGEAVSQVSLNHKTDSDGQ